MAQVVVFIALPPFHHIIVTILLRKVSRKISISVSSLFFNRDDFLLLLSSLLAVTVISI
jgi:hypothetical protein